MQSQTRKRTNYENYDLETQEERSTLPEVSPQTPAHSTHWYNSTPLAKKIRQTNTFGNYSRVG
jgi:hypothetical protein